MEKVNTTFRTTYYVLGMVAAPGLLIRYLGGPGWARDLSSTLIRLGAIGLLIDGFALRGAEPLMIALVQLGTDQEHADTAAGRP